MVVCVSEPGAGQREAGSAGQAVDSAAGEGQPRAHLLPDGPYAGHPGRLPDLQALPVPGRPWEGAL